ncbi:MAG TPA: nucleotidyl transferase AbiEii/AbiGii toxin family protein [Gammaproteobacteria bacterium]|nr:nucleotidyl transferase AbiEii/AbiGii toxin family protein [Gammaproteobacteria bacterium]
MLDNKLKGLIRDARAALGLPISVIEKDYYVTQVIHALSDTENDYFRLIFCGGTSLAKAYKIVKRMSEDVDFKIQIKKSKANFSKTRFLKELKEFRNDIISKLVIPGLKIGSPVIRNEGKYFKIEVNYPSAFSMITSLRPHILLEFAVSDIRLSVENLSIKTLIEDTLENVVIFTPSLTQCVSIDETAIEKWVGLTRRIIAIDRAYHSDDETLVRHVYDLNAIKQANRINADFFSLAKSVVKNDATQFKNQHPEYAINAANEIGLSLSLLKKKSHWKERYQAFIETMVYDNAAVPEYEDAMKVLEQMSAGVIELLHH